eukprot:g29266.t1
MVEGVDAYGCSANQAGYFVLDGIKLLECCCDCTHPGKWGVFRHSPDLCLVDGGQALESQVDSRNVAKHFATIGEHPHFSPYDGGKVIDEADEDGWAQDTALRTPAHHLICQ